MLDFFVKYWLQFLLGLVATGLTWFFKRYWSFRTAKLEADRVKRYAELENKIVTRVEGEINKENTESHAADAKMEKELARLSSNIDGLTIGVLSIQGREFRHQCRTLLKNDHIITVDEYEQFEEDYDAYKGLGGNHKGDALHEAVVEKFNSQVSAGK